MQYYEEYMRMAGLPQMYNPMMQYPAAALESMYPRCYHIIYPRVRRMCDMMEYQGLNADTVTPAMMNQMADRIYDEVSPMIEDDMVEQNMMETETQMMPIMHEDYNNMDDRQFFPIRRRRTLRDLITILLIRELLRRRRPGY